MLCSLALLPLGLWRSLAFLSLALRFRLGALPLLILLPLLLLLVLLILLLHLLLLPLLILLILLALLVLPLRLLLTLLILLPLLSRLHTLLIILLRYRLTRLVAVPLGLDRMLLFDRARIAIPGIIPLIARQRCGSRGGTAVPLVPPASTLFPVTAPVVTPAWRRVGMPATEISWRLAVVAHRNAQHIRRHIITIHSIPRPVVPAACIPVITLEHPVQAVVKEVI